MATSPMPCPWLPVRNTAAVVIRRQTAFSGTSAFRHRGLMIALACVALVSTACTGDNKTAVPAGAPQGEAVTADLGPPPPTTAVAGSSSSIVGACWADNPSNKSYFIDLPIDCRSTNAFQVFAVVDLTDRFGQAWPGRLGQDLDTATEGELVQLAIQRCTEEFRRITGRDPESVADGERMSVHEPISDRAWQASAGRAVCTSRRLIVP